MRRNRAGANMNRRITLRVWEVADNLQGLPAGEYQETGLWAEVLDNATPALEPVPFSASQTGGQWQDTMQAAVTGAAPGSMTRYRVRLIPGLDAMGAGGLSVHERRLWAGQFPETIAYLVRNLETDGTRRFMVLTCERWPNMDYTPEGPEVTA